MTDSDLRRRKINQNQNGKQKMQRKRKEKPTNSLHTSLICLIISAAFLTGFLVAYVDKLPWHLGHHAIDSIAGKLGYDRPVHAVVIDAGSTGSRVLAFTFHEAFLDGHLVLDKELFEFNKKGLSSFADNPEKGVESIAALIDLAKAEIPEKYWSKTPITLKATAGLRLLPPQKSKALLDALKKYFETIPFLSNEHSVEIMDGTDEGIFSWFTVNFLLDRFTGNPSTTVAALDLGGGSTQVTFSALTPASLSQKEYIHDAVSPKGSIKVYTHSFLGLGLKAARKEILTLGQGTKTNVSNECINHIIKNKKYNYGGVDYYVSGPEKDYLTTKKKYENNSQFEGEETPVVNFVKCESLASLYVTSKAKAPAELTNKNIFAFSYYFDRATEAGLIDPYTGGSIKLSQFRDAAKRVCAEANADQPFMCLDLTFITVLLEKGLGLDPNTYINLFKKVKGHEISWALGAAFALLKS